ncbi:hypothetical protein C8Q78DRAFT_779318 [Trametes maxima]|nr:hypothetical protein C8Q78DRAFT_779318 [Trametes maxima]
MRSHLYLILSRPRRPPRFPRWAVLAHTQSAATAQRCSPSRAFEQPAHRHLQPSPAAVSAPASVRRSPAHGRLSPRVDDGPAQAGPADVKSPSRRPNTHRLHDHRTTSPGPPDARPCSRRTYGGTSPAARRRLDLGSSLVFVQSESERSQSRLECTRAHSSSHNRPTAL